MKETLSIKLFRTLNKGRERLGKDAVSRISRFVASQKTGDDAFVNKSKNADVYYTMFGWLLSCVLDIRLDNKKTAHYVEELRTDSMDLIHCAAYARCRMIRRLPGGKAGWIRKMLPANRGLETATLRFLRTGNGTGTGRFAVKPDSAYSGFPHGDPESPYSRFLRLSMLEDTGQKYDGTAETVHSLSAYKAPGGGYSNIRQSTVSGDVRAGGRATTNATVAALAVIGQLDGYRLNDDVLFLRDMQHETGGFAATVQSPVPDLLSTATALFMLRCHDIEPKISPRDFIEAHWLDSGGFAATLADGTSDVEYTFYGLLAMGALI
ncbi:MAG: hypothetical protein LBJ47_06780 [Tannerella sp.]|jgi:hypothetical protein|nr:hypothetical protein [Tannerella sp.]